MPHRPQLTNLRAVQTCEYRSTPPRDAITGSRQALASKKDPAEIIADVRGHLDTISTLSVELFNHLGDLL